MDLLKAAFASLTLLVGAVLALGSIEQLEQARSLGNGRLAAFLHSSNHTTALRAALAIGRTQQPGGARLLLPIRAIETRQCAPWRFTGWGSSAARMRPARRSAHCSIPAAPSSLQRWMPAIGLKRPARFQRVKRRPPSAHQRALARGRCAGARTFCNHTRSVLQRRARPRRAGVAEQRLPQGEECVRAVAHRLVHLPGLCEERLAQCSQGRGCGSG